MDAALLAKVTEIQDRVNARVAQELEAAEREWLNWVATSPARIAPPLVAQPPKAEDFTSQVDVAQLFAPFVNLPATPSIVAIADEVGAARHHLSDAQVDMLSQLVANSANWTGCAGDGFNRFASSLNHANFEHITLLDELHRLFGAYVQLIEATRAAAHELADQTIAGLQNLGPV